jgi:TolA-binding protein
VAEEEGTDQFLLQVERAGELFNAAEYGLALPLLQKVSRALPGRPDLLWKAALSAVHLKRWREASELLQEFTSRFPDDQNFPAALMHLADSYSSLGLYGRARKSYYRLIALSGRLTDEQRALLPIAYGKVADCYRLEASMIEAARAHE